MPIAIISHRTWHPRHLALTPPLYRSDHSKITNQKRDLRPNKRKLSGWSLTVLNFSKLSQSDFGRGKRRGEAETKDVKEIEEAELGPNIL